MRDGAFYPGFAAAVRNVICWCSFLWMFTLMEDGALRGIRLLPFLAAGTASYFISRLFLLRPRTLPALAALGAAQAAVCIPLLLGCFSTLEGIAWTLLGAAAVAAVVICNILNCLEPPTAPKCITAMELTTLYSLFFLWLQAVRDIDPPYSLPLLSASVLSLSVVLYQRVASVGGSEGRGRLRSSLIVLAALTLVALASAAFLPVGLGPLGEGARLLYHGVVFCLKTLLHALNLFFEWLLSLLPPVNPEPADVPSEIPQLLPELAEESEANPALALILGIIGLCLLAALLAFLLFRLRKLRFGGAGKRETAGAVRRKRLPLPERLREICKALREKLAFAMAAWSHRDAPQGLYLFLLRAGAWLDIRKARGETPGAYIRRLARLSGVSAGAQAALGTLSASLERCLYAEAAPPAFPREAGRLIRREFRGRVLRGRLRRLFPKRQDGFAAKN